MKNMKKIAALAMAAVMAISMAGCGAGSEKVDKKKPTNGGTPVEIAYWNSGLGTKYLDKMIEAFNAKQSDWYVYYTATAKNDAIKSTFGLDDVDTVDLYFSTKPATNKWMEPLDDVLNATAEGDGKSLKDKFSAAYLEYEKSTDGHYYTLSWGGGVVGIVYNEVLFEKAGIKDIPRTTNELAVACDMLNEAGVTPMIHFKPEMTHAGYYCYMLDTWQSQYDGMDYYKHTFYENPSKDVLMKKDGRYQVMKAMEKFITADYILDGSNSQDAISAQTLFLNTDIGMMVNGSWLANEMSGTGKIDNFSVMKTPVISEIVNKLTTVKGDTELRNLISAIDAVTDGKVELSEYKSGNDYKVNGKSVSAKDWEYVKSARNSVSTIYPQQVLWIPSYSTEKEGAKEFLKFFYSDEGYKLYTDELHMTLPLQPSTGDLDVSTWNKFEQEMYHLYQVAEQDINSAFATRHTLWTAGGAEPYAYYPFIEYFCSNNPADRVTADEAWEQIMSTIQSDYEVWEANIK